MSLSKRAQARNERTIQDLIKSVPGNNICADCFAPNPGECAMGGRKSCANYPTTGWASWSVSGKSAISLYISRGDTYSFQLGIFLCMRCAALHRKYALALSFAFDHN
jgi:hypothetical protein